MANNQKKYISLSKLSTFLENLSAKFAALYHTHKLSDITDYTVDTSLSPTSINPVQNKVIDAEFDAISNAMGALELAIDGKSDASHNHDDLYYTESEVNERLNDVKIDSSNKDAVILAEAQKGINALQTALNTHANNANIHITSDERAAWNGKVDKTYVDNELAKKSSSTHIHDQYLEASDIANKTDKNYVDAEINAAIAEAKIDSSNKDAVILAEFQSNLSNYYTKADIDTLELVTVADIDAICGITT